MDRFFRIAHWTLVISLAASAVASLLDQRGAAIWLGAPAILFSGWRFVGHLVTLDDDFPGGWSNPDGDKAIVTSSLRSLGLSALIFASTLFVVFAWPF